ncbi:endonuclease/exonuclease/phosphatase family protein [Thermomonas carbonis]|uniref:Endonuclease/exonuclease/phosphatase family protein n=1 Tax=Thermomonas carbonis TaxID=1463158 RepID=A0A7G9STV5_9GAMM|nr:endonuclease/exonuclease/phosphatase family protein [Thermomonas carbonis]QNN71280.1 endonuclease/exonuclease/phosphatase family protein [Thermomonas carbonis]GHC10673.1 hydrolase [Thermomonas carbonis]
MKHHALLATLCLLATSCTGIPDRGIEASAASTITLASWNMEHLAERNGSGCRPRTDADYAAMRDYVDALAADVIAFQEVESRAAAERVFDPSRYSVVIETRIGTGRNGECGGRPGLTINAQRTGFAIRKGLAFDRLADVTDVQVGNPDLRSGVDVIVRPVNGTPIRLLSVHLKAGCSAGDRNDACATLFEQLPMLERWIDARASEEIRFAVLGDFNRRLVMPGDKVWADWDDALPANADLARASGDQSARCNPRYKDFIDYIVLDRRATADQLDFDERTFTADPLSDHCAITTRLRLQ